MQVIDTRGHLCPVPLIMTKRAIKAALDGEQFKIITDNDTAQCNLITFLQESGYEPIIRDENIYFAKNGSPLEVDPHCTVTCNTADYVVVFKGETMGSGDDELGAILLRGCISTFTEIENKPRTIIMYNAGVKLAINGSDTATSLERLADQGVQIIVCGACIDFYDIKTNLSQCVVIGNMLKINTILSQASSVIYP